MFFEDFEQKNLDKRWGYPDDSKYKRFSPSSIFKESRKKRDSNVELRAAKKNEYYGVTAIFDEPFHPSKGIIVQFDSTATEGHTCGGRYLKLLTHNVSLSSKDLSNSTPFSILFGPDKCDPMGQIRLILNHRDLVTGLPIEKHWTPLIPMKDDTLPHVYTLVIRPSNNFVEVMEDGVIVAEGSLFEHLDPPINPPEMIPDPDDVKPIDWEDEEWIPDPNAKQPSDWVTASVIVNKEAKKPAGWLDDEPRLIPKKGAKKPKVWNDEEDGEWTPPMIPNPKCDKVGCGKWRRPMMPNPAFKGRWEPPRIRNPGYKGKWVQRVIPNPDVHLVDKEPLSNIGLIWAVAIEIWTTDDGYQWDNIYVGRSVKDAEALRDDRWRPKFLKEKEAVEKAKEKAERKRVKDKEDLERAKRRNSRGDGDPQGFPLLVLQIYENLGPIKPVLRPLAVAIRRTPNTAYLLLCLPFGALLFLVVISTMPKQHHIDLGPDSDDEDEKKEDKEAKVALKDKSDKAISEAEGKSPKVAVAKTRK